MIKFKKLLMPSLLVMMMGVWNSCDKDDDPGKGDSGKYSIVGKWLDSREEDVYHQFKSDGYYELGEIGEDDGVFGKWSLKGNELTITITGEHFDGEIENYPKDEYEYETLYITWINENEIHVRQYEYDEDDEDIDDYVDLIWTRMAE